MQKRKAPRRKTKECVGLIGIGLMGTAMAERLLAGGFAVVGWDVDAKRCRALSRLGGTAAASASDVLSICNRVILSLPDSNIVAQVLESLRPSLRAGLTLIDTSTGDPAPAAALGAKLAKRRIAYLDATVSGNSAQLRQGDVTVMVGGTPEGFARCHDLLRTFARQIFHTGPCGTGTKMKLVTNLVLGLNRAALAEGLVFAKSLGLDPAATLAIMQAGAAYSRIMDAKGRKMVTHDFEPQARLSQHLKDVRLILAAGKKSGAKLPLSKAHKKLLEIAEAMGLGTLDNSAIVRAFEADRKMARRRRHGWLHR